MTAPIVNVNQSLVSVQITDNSGTTDVYVAYGATLLASLSDVNIGDKSDRSLLYYDVATSKFVADEDHTFIAIDGTTAATPTTLVATDNVVVNDGGVMKQVALSDFVTFLENQTASELDIDGGFY